MVKRVVMMMEKRLLMVVVVMLLLLQRKKKKKKNACFVACWNIFQQATKNEEDERTGPGQGDPTRFGSTGSTGFDQWTGQTGLTGQTGQTGHDPTQPGRVRPDPRPTYYFINKNIYIYFN
ncbi:hypothetical protein Sjap_024353 [Stephania japonica]|uniref:Secreted protein n=1 Tax=Stephania japonica TaxID=461633 RepID=A0AAP0ED75_9MAGN